MKPGETTPLQITLFDGYNSIFETDLNCLFDSRDELKEFFDDLLKDLEFRGFVGESHTDMSASFVKKPFTGYTLN